MNQAIRLEKKTERAVKKFILNNVLRPSVISNRVGDEVNAQALDKQT